MFAGYLLIYQVFCFASAYLVCRIPFRLVAVLLLLLLLLLILLLLLGLFACTCLTHHHLLLPLLLLIRLTHSTPSPVPPLLPLQTFARHYSQLRHTNKLSASRWWILHYTHKAHAHIHTHLRNYSLWNLGYWGGGEEVHTICGVYIWVNWIRKLIRMLKYSFIVQV